MRQPVKFILSVLLSLISVYKMQSQELPSLPKAAEVTVGSLPNGVSLYIVKDQSSKGFADFALVRKGGPAVEEFRKALVSLPHFLNRRPCDFLADNAVGYGRGGFISHRDDATVLRFSDVPIYKKEIQDSTLLLLSDIMAQSRAPQAIFISGDVDVPKIRERAELFSMIVPLLDSKIPTAEEEWIARDELRSKVLMNSTKNVAALDFIYSARRIGRNNLPTVLPLVTRKYSAELGEILSGRIRKAFRLAGIPLADVRFRYKDSSEDSLNERYTLSVFVPADKVDLSLALVGRTLGSFDKTGADLSEFIRAREVASAPSVRVPDRRKNAANIDRCISSFLYGASLASVETIDNFNAGRTLDDARELELFNSFARALIDSTRNLAIRCQVPGVKFYQGVPVSSFAVGWAQSSAAAASEEPVPQFNQPASRVKLRSEAVEPLSDGSLLTFANGLKVVVKQSPAKGSLHYALMLNGGYASIKEISHGESAFIGDMLDICDIGGVRAVDFRNALLVEGITMNVEVMPTRMVISGNAPAAKVQNVLSALLTLAKSRGVNREEYEYFRSCERLREDMLALSPRNVKALMDSAISPKYLFSDLRNASSLNDDLPDKAEQYFARQFSKFDDGILMLIGDIDPEVQKKELPKILGDFPAQKITSPRPNVDFQMIAGKTTTIKNSAAGTVGGAEVGTSMEIAALVPFNLATYMSFRVACDFIQARLVSAMLPLGASVTVEGVEETFPRERLKLYVQCHPCNEDGLPYGVDAAGPIEVMAQLRRVMTGMTSINLDKNELQAYKARLQANVESDIKRPEFLASKIAIRYSESKDMVSSARSAVGAVTAESVAMVLEALASGSWTEYIIL